MRWCSCSDVASGRPTSSRFSVSSTIRYDSAAAVGTARAADRARAAISMPPGRREAGIPASRPRCITAICPAPCAHREARAVASRPSRQVLQEARCTSSSSAAAGWAASWPAHSSRWTTPWPSSTRTRARSAVSRRTSAARPSSASASTAITSTAAGIDEAGAFASVTSGDNSNILCARIARETYGIEHVVARIYDPRRALIYQRLGIPTVATVAWTTDQVLRRLLAGGGPERLGRPDRRGRADRAADPAQGGRQEARAPQPAGTVLAHRGHAIRQGADRHQRHDRPGRRRARVRVRDQRRSTSCRHTSSPEATTDACRDRGGRQRRPVHRQRPRRGRPRGAAHRAEPRRSSKRPTGATESSGCSPTRARSRRCGRPGSSAARSWSRRPATTRTTS